MSLLNKKINLFVLFGLLLSCAKENPVGYVGQPVTVSVDAPDEDTDLEFIWELINVPGNSYLSNTDIVAGDDLYSVIFIPDVPGNYSIEVSVFQYNDEIETQSFDFTVLDESEFLEQNTSSKTSVEDDTLALKELLYNEIEEDSWYNSEEVSKYISGETSDTVLSSTTEVETPKEKINNTPAPVKKVTKKRIKGKSIPFDSNRFTIQIASKKRLDDAKKVAAVLIETGYDAYIQKAFFEENGETWYRIRVGSYDNRKTASAVAESLSKTRRERAWVDYVRYEN